jgi:integrase
MRAIDRLSPTKIRALTAGMHPDGNGLYLAVSSTGSKSWVLRYRSHGRQREMGLGSLSVFNLAEARERARAQRQLLADGIDPLELRHGARLRDEAEALRKVTFAQAAGELVELKRPGWRSEKYGTQWIAVLEADIYPVFGAQPVAAVDTDLVLRAMRPLWARAPVTAGRVRTRIEAVLDYAATRGYRDQGPNPARWTGHLEHLLPGQVTRVNHFAAMPYRDVPDFMARLRRRREKLSELALEWTILTAARSGETCGTPESEIDWGARLWTIPAERMKGHRMHVVPLDARLEEIWNLAIFRTPAGALAKIFRVTDLQMRHVAHELSDQPVTVHGFRSSFRDWAAENGVARDLAEAALAHKVKDATEAAYNRTALVEQRRAVMERWADFCWGG